MSCGRLLQAGDDYDNNNVKTAHSVCLKDAQKTNVKDK